ncbi:MAG: Succinate semialdehyde dehydrogenase [Gammaproteobacteria bacterium]|nr:Succinate semialdehyde dehydrogenase [Gammaproteobacteria bacterium]HEV7444712.1 aldehyde dehydrogenase family protein [Steroidobacteraceae bacterium]
MNASPALTQYQIPLQPDPSAAVAKFLKRPPRLFIGGEWVESKSRERISVVDPATGREIASVADANEADVDRAVAAARKAFESGPWADMLPADRQALLWKLSDLVEKNMDELAELESIDNGKTKFMATVVDVAGTRDYFRYMAGWATRIEGSTFATSIHGPPGVKFHTYTQREPVGVVAQIVPWNFPLAMAAWKLGPALATGCTCILKPAEQTPLTALRLAELIAEAGFPPGVVNVLTGLGETTGAALVAHPGVDKVAFTGSTPVGKLINKSATDTLKRVSLELGGKSPVIVLPDADIDSVIGGAANAIFFNAGQVCCAGTRLFAHKKVFDRVVEGISTAASSIQLGPGLDPKTQMGPLVSREQQERVLGYIESGRKEGATVVAGGETPSSPGFYVKPTVLANVRSDMKVVREEIFGPVLVAQRFEDLDDIAALANDTPYGLAASIWSNDLRAVQRLVPRIRAGTVWVNCHNFVDPNMPFGGFKQSGFGREHGRAVLDLYTELKSVCMAI